MSEWKDLLEVGIRRQVKRAKILQKESLTDCENELKFQFTGDWPWMVGLGYTSPSQPELQFKCGATLISDAWVITAAHCVMYTGNWKL